MRARHGLADAMTPACSTVLRQAFPCLVEACRLEIDLWAPIMVTSATMSRSSRAISALFFLLNVAACSSSTASGAK